MPARPTHPGAASFVVAAFATIHRADSMGSDQVVSSLTVPHDAIYPTYRTLRAASSR